MSDAIAPELAQATNGFAVRLHRAIAAAGGNAAASPASIATALAMTWAGGGLVLFLGRVVDPAAG